MQFKKETRCPVCAEDMEAKIHIAETIPQYKCNNVECYMHDKNQLNHETIKKLDTQIQDRIKKSKINTVKTILLKLHPNLCPCDYCPGDECHLSNFMAVNNPEICAIAIVEYLEKEI